MLVLKTGKEAILKPLQAIAGVVERKQTLPILSNVLIEVQGERAAFVATDLELELTAWASEGVRADSAFTVSARKLLDICRSLPEIEIALELVGEQLRLTAGKSRFSLQTLPARDFPRLVIPEGEGIAFAIPQGRLRRLLARVQYAMAVQDMRFYLNGLLMQIQDGRLIVAATDGHRLAVDSVALDQAPDRALEVILPRKAVLELIKLLGDGDEAVEVQVAPQQVVVRGRAFELRSKVVDGKFPDYQRVIPTGYEKVFAIGRLPLSQALGRAAILTNEKYRGVRLAITPGSLRIVCTNNEQEEAQEELDIDYDKAPLDIGFNVQYLQDVLSNLDSESVRCAFGDPSSSLLITVPGEDSFRYVVMPMRI